MQAQKIAVGPPQSQEMSAQLLVANSSNFPSGSVPVILLEFFSGAVNFNVTLADIRENALLPKHRPESSSVCRQERSRWGLVYLHP